MSTNDEPKLGASAEAPFAVHQVSAFVGDWISRLGSVWVEGQLIEVKPNKGLAYLTLRDVQSEEVLKMYMQSSSFAQITPKLEAGARVVAEAKADWWPKRGSMQFKVFQLRSVGLGELMARLEALRNILASEGLFDPERKRPLPFLPRRIGLICGKNSDAMHDVIKNAQRRWPDVEFVVREVAVQGATAAKAVSTALTELDAIDDVDVIVIARGGGSFEDLLPFSDEGLVRLAAKSNTPIVSAIGHEENRPLLDYVADFRASTPTDAARRIVPDVVQELADLKNARIQINQLVTSKLDYLNHQLQLVLAKPALAHPSELIDQRLEFNQQKRDSILKVIKNKIAIESTGLAGLKTTLRALSPQGTLERGYAIVRDEKGQVVSSAKVAKAKKLLLIKFADGSTEVESKN
ncbi:MAG: hypothetical protein RLZZ571_22 [Actinomycetota bacterium]